MQTFLPYASFKHSASVLDYRRLGKQRVEVLQILNTLSGETSGWRNHPAVKMWRGHERNLSVYGITICVEWQNRGYRDSCLAKISKLASEFPIESFKFPDWFGNRAFHLAHKSNLKRKDTSYYGTWWPEVPVDLPYIWPISQERRILQ